MTIPIHGTGTTGGNAVIDNLVEPGDVVLAAINGYWTELMANMSQRLGNVWIINNPIPLAIRNNQSRNNNNFVAEIDIYYRSYHRCTSYTLP